MDSGFVLADGARLATNLTTVVTAVIAALAGVRPEICMIDVPSLIRSVREPIQASGVKQSEP